MEKWGEKTLRTYKDNPWILRKNNGDVTPTRRSVTLSIDISLDDFSEREEGLLLHALAGFLHVPATAIRVVKKERGSVQLTLDLPGKVAAKLSSAYDNNSSELFTALADVGFKLLPASPHRHSSAENQQPAATTPAGNRRRLLTDDRENRLGILRGGKAEEHEEVQEWLNRERERREAGRVLLVGTNKQQIDRIRIRIEAGPYLVDSILLMEEIVLERYFQTHEPDFILVAFDKIRLYQCALLYQSLKLKRPTSVIYLVTTETLAVEIYSKFEDIGIDRSCILGLEGKALEILMFGPEFEESSA